MWGGGARLSISCLCPALALQDNIPYPVLLDPAREHGLRARPFGGHEGLVRQMDKPQGPSVTTPMAFPPSSTGTQHEQLQSARVA